MSVNLRELLASLTPDSPAVVLLDSGGFIWWADQHGPDGRWMLCGVGVPQHPDETGMAVPAWMNIMTAEEAEKYGPFVRLEESGEMLSMICKQEGPDGDG